MQLRLNLIIFSFYNPTIVVNDGKVTVKWTNPMEYCEATKEFDSLETAQQYINRNPSLYYQLGVGQIREK